METNYITIHKDKKYGGFDFGISSAVKDLTVEEYNNLRLMLITAIGVMENMYRTANSPTVGVTSISDQD